MGYKGLAGRWGHRLVGHHRAGPSELGELGFVRSPFQLEIVSTGKLGLIGHHARGCLASLLLLNFPIC